ncbi:MAG: recombination protein RecR [Candidatus Latescibacteria bacterium]|nr:recombination protein RecR [Candidatus Latescibacterota bacterium]
MKSDPIQQLIAELEKLPGIGRRTAERLAFHLIKAGEEEIVPLIEAIVGIKDRVHFCPICYNLTDTDPCRICSDSRRDRSTICVVEEPKDVFAIEKTHQYKGLYHVLGGVISPSSGVGPEKLRIKELLARIKSPVEEVVLATSAGVEGEATAIYLTKVLSNYGVKVTQLARGLPVGGDLDIADEQTIIRAFKGRQVVTPDERKRQATRSHKM